jgi:hypothetical protein
VPEFVTVITCVAVPFTETVPKGCGVGEKARLASVPPVPEMASVAVSVFDPKFPKLS